MPLAATDAQAATDAVVRDPARQNVVVRLCMFLLLEQEWTRILQSA